MNLLIFFAGIKKYAFTVNKIFLYLYIIRKQINKKSILENFENLILLIDEIVDEGYYFWNFIKLYFFQFKKNNFKS